MTLRRFLLIILVLASPLAADQVLYTQNGEEYHGTVVGTTEGKMRFRVGDEERTFPLADVLRVEFQRSREYDDARTADDLRRSSSFFDHVLAPSTEELAKRFPQADYVVLAHHVLLQVDRRGRWQLARLQAWRVLKQSGADVARRAFYYFPDRQRMEVRFGLTVLPDGKVTRIADTALKDEALYPELAAYNFRHRLRFNMRGAVPGATLLLSTVQSGRATALWPVVLDEVYGGSRPILDRSVKITGRGKIDLEALNGLPPSGPWREWTLRDVPQLFPEPLMPPLTVFCPRLVAAAPRATWHDLAEAFLRRAGAETTLPTKGVTPRGLFDQVRTSVRLQDVPLDALPDGPARPGAVLVRGYGNEVERALLLAALLRGAGSRAETLLVRGRDYGPLVKDVPRLNGFRHAVVKLVPKKGRPVWLQVDDDDRGYGELHPVVQGAPALNLHSGHVETVPIHKPEREGVWRSVEVELQADGAAVVRDSYRLTGDNARAYRGLKSMSKASLETWAARFVGSESTGVDLVEFKHSDFGRANPEERCDFVYRVPALADRSGDFLLCRLPNAELDATDVGRSDRKLALYWRGREREEARFAIRAPSGYRVYALPSGIHLTTPHWVASAAFRLDQSGPRVATFRDIWQRTSLDASRDRYAGYRTALVARSRLRGEAIVFIKDTAPGAAPKPVKATGSEQP